jgi:plasmid stabilization system protein ParE
MLESAIRSLDEFPERCVVAPEDEEVDEFEVRQLILDQFRVLFFVRERVVFVLHIRHGSRRTATLSELAEAIREGRI